MSTQTQTQTPTLTAHPLFFELRAVEPLWLHAHNGSALRGMLYGTLRLMSAGGPAAMTPSALQFRPHDPVLERLLATLDEDSDRGQDVARPYVIVPPILTETQRETHVLMPGELLTFGITLLGTAIEAFQFIVLALQQAGQAGLGRFWPQKQGRGEFELVRASAHNALTGTTQELYVLGSRMVQWPAVVVTHADIVAQVAHDVQGNPHRLRLYFHSPLSLRQHGRLIDVPHFHVLVHRLIERLTQLSETHAEARLPGLPADREARNALLHLADQVQLVNNQTSWVSARGFSDRTSKPTDLGGLMGVAEYVTEHPEGLAPFMTLLRWGELTHAGRHTVKGNGVFRVQIRN